jgi:hypothetical protein
MVPIGIPNNGQTFTIVAPDPTQLVTVTVTILFDDGTTITADYPFHSISIAEGAWLLFLCQLRSERMKPIPWWEWDPEKLRQLTQDYSKPELRLFVQRVAQLLQTLTQLSDLGQEGRSRR